MPDELNYSALRLLWDILQSIGVLVVIVWNIIDRRRRQNSEGIDQVKEDFKGLNSRVQKLETNQKQLPNHKDLSEVKTEMAGLKEKIDAQNNLLQTIHQFLLTNKKGE